MLGAQDCFQAGITSSLQPSNLRLRRAVSDRSSPDARQHPRCVLALLWNEGFWETPLWNWGERREGLARALGNTFVEMGIM